MRRNGIDLTRVRDPPTSPHRLLQSRVARIATTASSVATGLSCEDRFSRNQSMTTRWSPPSGGTGGGDRAYVLSWTRTTPGGWFPRSGHRRLRWLCSCPYMPSTYCLCSSRQVWLDICPDRPIRGQNLYKNNVSTNVRYVSSIEFGGRVFQIGVQIGKHVNYDANDWEGWE